MMKQKIIILQIILLSIIACKKDKSSNNTSIYDDKIKHQISFSINTDMSDFKILNGSSSTAIAKSNISPNTKGAVKYIYYFPYKYINPEDRENSNLSIPKKNDVIIMDNKNENFGVINDELNEGLYELIFIATNDSLVFDSQSNGEANLVSYFINKNPINSDFFYKKVTLSVDGKLTSSTPILLDRLVTSIQIIIQDPIPSDIKAIYVHKEDSYFLNVIGHRLVDDKLFDPSIDYDFKKNIMVDDFGKKNTLLDLYYIKALGFHRYLADTSKTMNLKITAVGIDGEKKYEKKIDSVPSEIGKRTQLKGKLFTKSIDGAELNLADTSWTINKTINF